MSHNTRIRPPGTWLATSPILPAEEEAFDLAQFQSINGDLGGTWAPAGIITIGGSGLTVTGEFAATAVVDLEVINGGGGLVIDSGADMTVSTGGVFNLGGATHLTGVFNVDSGSSFLVKSGSNYEFQNGSLFNLDNNANFIAVAGSIFATAGTFQASGASSFVAPGTLNVDCATEFSAGVITLNTSAWMRQGSMFLNGAKAVTTYRHATINDASVTAGIENDFYTITALTAIRTITLRKSATGGAPAAVEGNVLEFTCLTGAAFKVIFANESAGLVALTLNLATWSIKFIFRAGEWHVASAWDGASWAANGGAWS